MAVKTFTTGEVLTASDTNTYLANGGLVTIAGATFSGVNTVDITGFSSSYKFYRLMWRVRRTDAVGNSSATFQTYVGTTPQTTAYYYSAFYSNYVGATGNLVQGNNAANAWWTPSDSATADSPTALDIVSTPSGGFSWTGTAWYVGNGYSLFYGGSVGPGTTVSKIRVTMATGQHAGEWILMAQRTYT